MALYVLMIVSAFANGWNVLFYGYFLWRAPGYGSLMMLLWPLVYLVSSVLEVRKLEAVLSGCEYTSPANARLFVAGSVMLLSLLQAGLTAYYLRVMERIGKERRK